MDILAPGSLSSNQPPDPKLQVGAYLVTNEKTLWEVVEVADGAVLCVNCATGYACQLGYNRMLWTAALRKKAAYLPG